MSILKTSLFVLFSVVNGFNLDTTATDNPVLPFIVLTTKSVGLPRPRF